MMDGCRAVLARAPLGILAAALWLAGASEVSAQTRDGGKFDGAVWRFSMTPKTSGPVLLGRFRVSDRVLYQKAAPEDPNFSKPVGKNHPRRDRTRIEFTDLRAKDSRGEFHTGLKGTVLLTFNRFGEWSGSLIDAEGRHWNFKCSRVQE